jgi:putative ABC transport system permease protein
MFVSVKERTNIIGIKKALGAKNYIVLLEFLIESIVLCIIGGLVGILMTYGVINLIAKLADFEMVMSMNNAIIGVVVSVVVGIVAGIIPAFLASILDPVEAMRR